MYLDHFNFKELPFTLTPDTNYFCHLESHQEAFEMLKFSLNSGDGFIKIVGEVGSGKTLLCRKLLDSLDENFVTIWIPNPDLTPIELRHAIVSELGIHLETSMDQHELFSTINQYLFMLHQQGKQVVILVDEAQALSTESLEALRLLTNLETNKNKLLQVVLFGQPELEKKLNLPHLRQLKQRIIFSYYLSKLKRKELDFYLLHRLATAGNLQLNLFTRRACNLLFKASQGTPRIINVLCHKALLIAYGRGQRQITHKIMTIAVQDTDVAQSDAYIRFLIWTLVTLGLLTSGIFCWYLVQGIF